MYGTPALVPPLRAKRYRSRITDVVVAIILPWLIYFLAVSLFLFAYHDLKVLVIVIIAACLALSMSFLTFGWFARNGTFLAIGYLCLASLVIGTAVGLWLHEEYLQRYWELDSGMEYSSVDPLSDPRLTTNASIIHFVNGTFVDDRRTIGFVAQGSIFCLAPVASPGKKDSAVQYWATGEDCCEMRSNFDCGAARDAEALSAVVERTTPVYIKAINQARSVYGLEDVDINATRLVSFVADPQDTMSDIWDEALTIALVSMIIDLLMCSAAQARFVLVHSKKVLTVQDGRNPSLSCWSLAALKAVAPEAPRAAAYLGPWSGPLGALAGFQMFSVDLTGLVAEASVLAAADAGGHGHAAEGTLKLAWSTGRELLLSAISDEEATVAGMALASASWHATALYDGNSGLPTLPVEGGAKRQIEGGKGKLYPRTDPVAIGLITSADGRRCLLGRGSKHPAAMYTCISGFIDQCERVEDALRREALEETGIHLGKVELVQSQPWPIGRAGSCELMIGCRAVAKTEEISVNGAELQDARWFTRTEVRQMLQGSHPQGFNVPPSFAIAHHLIRDFAHPRITLSPRWPGFAVGCVVGLTAGLLIKKLRSRL